VVSIVPGIALSVLCYMKKKIVKHKPKDPQKVGKAVKTILGILTVLKLGAQLIHILQDLF
jgi:hypothetical protein